MAGPPAEQPGGSASAPDHFHPSLHLQRPQIKTRSLGSVTEFLLNVKVGFHSGCRCFRNVFRQLNKNPSGKLRQG